MFLVSAGCTPEKEIQLNIKIRSLLERRRWLVYKKYKLEQKVKRVEEKERLRREKERLEREQNERLEREQKERLKGMQNHNCAEEGCHANAPSYAEYHYGASPIKRSYCPYVPFVY